MIFDYAIRPAVASDGKKVAFIAGKALRQRIWLADIDGTQRRQLVGEDGDLFGRSSGFRWHQNRLHNRQVWRRIGRASLD